MTERVPASFRDPAGFVFRRDGVLYRQVNDRNRANYEALMASGLYDALVDRTLLVPHAEAEVPAAEPAKGSLVIRPEMVAAISYPYEWCPGQLRAAGVATLEIQRIAMEHGMTLRDASAYNIQFHHGRPVLIDTLSFEPMVEGLPWVAYSQYCRHFLAPLALMSHVDVRLGQLLRSEIDGVPLDLASKLLPRRTRLQWGLGVHLHAHSSSQQRHAGDGEGSSPGREVSNRALLGLIDSLMAVTKRLKWQPPASTWRDYYAAAESYSDESSAHKRDVVADLLKSIQAEMIWDLGANTGQFSRLAAEVTGAQVLAIEMDPSAVEIHWQECQRNGDARVLPLLSDLSNPSPSQGWGHRERDSLESRGPADAILALALVHHLAIGNNVPLPDVLQWLATLGRKVIIEWIPKDDPMVRRLLATREDIFDEYSTEHFEAAAKEVFDIRSRRELDDSLRTIYSLERH